MNKYVKDLLHYQYLLGETEEVEDYLHIAG